MQILINLCFIQSIVVNMNNDILKDVWIFKVIFLIDAIFKFIY